MNFREAMDALGLTSPEVARAFGLESQTVRQMRLEPDKPGFRAPPSDWRSRLAKMGREKGGDLQRIADELAAEG